MSNEIRSSESLADKLRMSVSANALGLVVSVTLTLFVPKALGIEAYGYWQLYGFYSAYVFLFHFGWVDGVLLRLGGISYRKLDFSKERPLFSLFCFVELIITFVCFLLALAIGGDRSVILICVSCNIFLVNIRYYILYVFQATSRVKDYSRYMKMDRYIYFLGTIILLIAGYRNYHLLLVVDLVAKIITVVGCLASSRELLPIPVPRIYKGIMGDAFVDVSAGIKLTIAYLSGILITGFVRFGIEWKWGVEAFGSTSLVLNISNMLVTFVSAAGIVLYPLLRRFKSATYPVAQKEITTVVSTITFAILTLFIPTKVILSAWLPSYSASISSMMLVFPICVFECQVSLVSNTFLKAIRQERQIMIANIVALILSLVGTLLSVAVFENVDLAMLTITIASAARCILSEIMLSCDLGTHTYFDCMVELVMVSVFIATNVALPEFQAFIMQTFAFTVYLFVSRKRVFRSFVKMSHFIRGNG